MDLLIIISVVAALAYFYQRGKANNVKSALIHRLENIISTAPALSVKADLFDGYKDPVVMFQIACDKAIRLEAYLAFEEHSDALIADYHAVESSSKYGIFDNKKWNKEINHLVEHFAVFYQGDIEDLYYLMLDTNKSLANQLEGQLQPMLKGASKKFSEQLLSVTEEYLS